MTYLRGRSLALAAITCGTILSSCGKSEPELPTFDPMDKIQKSHGWKVGDGIAVSPGKDQPTPHHVQSIASNWHDVDFETPPKALIPIKPSCSVTKPSLNSSKHLIIGDGRAKFLLMKNIEPPHLITLTSEALDKVAEKQAERMLETGIRKKPFASNIELPEYSMAMKDIFITKTSEPVAVALAGGGLYNFHLAPGVHLTGVVVYTGETGYNKTIQAAVAGVPDGVPVSFISETHKATKSCWTRIQHRPDKSWRKERNGVSRAAAMKPYWEKFHRRVRKDIGNFPDQNIISVSTADHFLIGPPPERYEDRIPYVAFGGKTIHYSEADYVNYGTYKENGAFTRQILDQYYEAHLAAGTK